MIKAFVSDLDGTLLNPDHVISKESAQAIRTVQRSGSRWIVATGRTWNTAHRLLKNADICCDFILLNGAEYRDAYGKLHIYNCLERDAVDMIIKILKQNQIDYEVNTNVGDFSTNLDVCNTARPMTQLTTMDAAGIEVRKIFAFSDDIMKVTRLKDKLQIQNRVTIVSSHETNIEFTAPEAQKGLMLEKVLALYDIKRTEVMIFGDGENDRSMFERFPHTRAMANACEQIKSKAEKVILSNAEDGVAKELALIGLL